jgi:hypothetical protein
MDIVMHGTRPINTGRKLSVSLFTRLSLIMAGYRRRLAMVAYQIRRTCSRTEHHMAR